MDRIEKFGQYIFLEKVGSGGMAELFKAKKRGLEGFERVLAIKRILPHLSLDEEFIKMFIDEAKLAALLSNKNIVQIYDFGKIESNYFIVMEYIRGKDLKTILKINKETDTKFPVVLTTFIAREVASALSYAHKLRDSKGDKLNIIHRDISPQNILISYDGEVKVVDFGIAKASAHTKTATGVLKGKLSYMSPEQAWGRIIDHRSDIFSLGIVMYEMLTGERLFKGDTELNTLEKVREAKIELLPTSLNAEIPLEIEEITLKALTKEISGRYQDASDMAAELAEFLRKISPVEPESALKQFMHKLFAVEIEEECRTDAMEETISTDFNEYSEVPSPDDYRVPEVETPVNLAPTPQKKQKNYLFALITLSVLGGIIILIIIFSQRTKEEKQAFNVPLSSQHDQESRQTDVSIDKILKEKDNVKRKGINDKRPAIQATAAEYEAIMIINAIPWANIYLDGKPYGTTPKTVKDLKGGTYSVRLENPNFPPWEKTVKIAEGKTIKVSHKFASFGKLIVNASPWGEVYVDDVLKGHTPITIDKVTTGKHEVRIEREGFMSFNQYVEIKEGTARHLSVNLEKKD
jgi:serine/threonine protein kinase